MKNLMRGIWSVFIVLLTFSCSKNNDVQPSKPPSNIPEITFVSSKIDSATGTSHAYVELKIAVADGDFDLGFQQDYFEDLKNLNISYLLKNPKGNSPDSILNPYATNFWNNMYVKTDAGYEQFSALGEPQTFYGHFGTIIDTRTETLGYETIKTGNYTGEIIFRFSLQEVLILTNNQPFIFKIRVLDRSLNISNEIETPELGSF